MTHPKWKAIEYKNPRTKTSCTGWVRVRTVEGNSFIDTTIAPRGKAVFRYTSDGKDYYVHPSNLNHPKFRS